MPVSKEAHCHGIQAIKGLAVTPREADVLACLLSGKGIKSIATILGISPRTVEAYVRTLMLKLGCASRDDIIARVEASGGLFALRAHYARLIGQPETLAPSPSLLSPKGAWRYRVLAVALGVSGTVGVFWSLCLGPSRPSYRSEFPLPHASLLLDRPSVLAKIDVLWEKGKKIQSVVLVGAGGSGKTTLARLYARGQRDPVVWEINETTRETRFQSFRDLAYALSRTPERREELAHIERLSSQEEKERTLFFFLKRCLREEGPWFLVYDNAEDLASVQDHFPQDVKGWGAGRVLITTRDSNSFNTRYVDTRAVLSIGDLTPAEGQGLFAKIFYGTPFAALSLAKKRAAATLLKEIPPLPLDIALAAYYLKSAKLSFREYLQKVRRPSQEEEGMQALLLGQVDRGFCTRYRIVATSAEKILQARPDLREALFSLSLCDAHKVPLKFFGGFSVPLRYYLEKYALLIQEPKKKDGQTLISLHSSTQDNLLAFFQASLSERERSLFVQNHLAHLKARLYTSESHLFLPHVEALAKKLPRLKLPQPVLTSCAGELNLLLGTLACENGNMLQAKQRLSLVINGPFFHRISLCAQADLLMFLGEACLDTGENDRGIALTKRGFALWKSVPHEGLQAVHNLKALGVAFSLENNFEASKACFEEALQRLSFLEHPKKAQTQANVHAQLAHLYSASLKKAYAQAAVDQARKALSLLGDKAPRDVIRWYKRRLGTVYQRLGQHQKALNLFQEVDQSFAQDHATWNCGKAGNDSQMGTALLRLGRLEEAKERLDLAITMADELFGPANRCSWESKAFRAEVRLHQGALGAAWADCAAVIDFSQRARDNYSTWLYALNFYHAALIKHRQKAFQASAAYFGRFCKEAKVLCRSLLEPSRLHRLQAQGAFVCDAPMEKGWAPYRQRAVLIARELALTCPPPCRTP